jgi:ABC-type multidrug transport system ATPase subunit
MATTTVASAPTSPTAADLGPVPALRARGLSVAAGRRVLVAPMDLDVAPGTVVGIAGPSGAGKTTLLEALAGLRPPATGRVEHRSGSDRVGFVPQDDIVHHDLSLARTLAHSARLRMPDEGPDCRRWVVAELLDLLDLTAVADVRVGDLSGGQRKRASLATELLSDPRLLFLDEPTSGLDPVRAAEVVTAVRRLAEQGVTVVMTTHDPGQLDGCDLVVLVARGGHVAFVGTPAQAGAHFDTTDLATVYPSLNEEPRDGGPSSSVPVPAPGRAPLRAARPRPRRCGSTGHQVRVLARRTVELLAANRLTLAVLLGSPALVITMMVVLFPAGGADGPRGAAAATQITFWLAFAGFFFGLTYGLLQIVGERPVVRREQVAGVRPSAYVLSKVLVLVPLLLAISTVLLLVLSATDRLPPTSADTWWALLLTLGLEAAAALALGLAASALVTDAAQATLALPMLCFPQVLFAGSVVPLDQMTPLGRAIGSVLATRWAYASLGDLLDLVDPRSAGAFAEPAVTGWLVLAGMAVAGTAVAVVALRRD